MRRLGDLAWNDWEPTQPLRAIEDQFTFAIEQVVKSKLPHLYHPAWLPLKQGVHAAAQERR